MKVSSKERFQQRLKKLIYKNHYMQSLFPSIKEQKPGIDLYAPIATV